MNRLMVDISEARKYTQDFNEGKYVPSLSFMFESNRGFTGVDNSHHEFTIRTFEKEEECLSWLEDNYSDHLEESKSQSLPPLREWMTIKNLQDADLISNTTKYHAGVRHQLYKGENLNAKLVKTVYNPAIDAMTFIFKTPATIKAHEPGYEPLIVDPHDDFKQKHNPGHSYTMMIQVLDFVKWLKETRPDNTAEPISWKEIKAVLDVAYVKIWCNCSSYHWFGKNYRATQFDCSLYPTNIPDKKMRGIYGEYDILCKHLGNLMKSQSIQFFLPQMASASQKILRGRGII